MQLANLLGKFLRLDEVTTIGLRYDVARMRILVPLDIKSSFLVLFCLHQKQTRLNF